MRLFANIYDKLAVPVIVCRDDPELSVVYLNGAAKLLFVPHQTATEIAGGEGPRTLARYCRFHSQEKFGVLELALRSRGAIGHFDALVLSFQDDVVKVRIQANAASLEGENYFILYLADAPDSRTSQSDADFLARILGISHYVPDVTRAIQAVLELTGEYARVSRAFIFEDISPTTSSNTHEWCAPGVQSVMAELQSLDKKEYNYDAFMNASGMLITNDTRLLPEKDRVILEGQGIKSIAILPLFHYDAPLGYIGFDDCERRRDWSMEEIQLLKNVASVIASLINRRVAERQSTRGQEVFRTVADNLDELVYISDLATYELKFVSKSLAAAMKCRPDSVLGQPCWAVLHRGQTGPCPFCPVPRIRDNKPGDPSYIWELHNSVGGKWYMVKDGIIDWIDGERAHLGTLVDITYRKQYEEQLKRFAATDAMTDVYNRKWGYGKLEDLFRADRETRSRRTLCFLDVDGLKLVNDRLGHSAGDEMIVNIVRTLFGCIRKDDFIVRWGGDEFLMLLNCRMEDAKSVVAKIKFGLDHFNNTRNKPYTLSVSVGLVDFAEPHATLDELIKEADRRMYDEKMERRRRRDSGGTRIL